jgi:sugar lactone lactonase YvrE
MQEPTGIAIDGEGNIFVSDRDNDRVRRVSVDGLIATVAGNGEALFSGDGGPALDATLDDPAGLAVDEEGVLYIADSNHHRVRRVDPDGVISTFAGTGQLGSDGDGGPATEAMLSDPESLLFDTAGNLFVGDSGANRIRRIAPDGTITTFAGTGEHGYGGDGGPATEATFRLSGDPASLAVGAAGNVYIGDSGNHVIRVVDPSGTISTLEVGS